MTVVFKSDGDDKDIYCNRAKTKLRIVKTTYGSYQVYFEDTKLKECYYLDDAKKIVIELLKLGIGRDRLNED